MKKFLFALMAGLCLVSCGSSDSEEAVPTVFQIVTYEGTANSVSTFTFRQINDSPLVTLTALWSTTAKLEKGQRILIGYQSMKPFESGDVTVLAASLINWGDVEVSSETDGWDITPLWLNSMWRSGEYINVDCSVEYSDQPRKFVLMADESTLSDPYPTLYLYHNKDNAIYSYMRRIYGSWNISKVWDNPECQGVIVKVHDTNREITEVKFEK